MTCKGGGDVVLRHNSLRDVFAHFCHRVRLGGQLEVGHGYGAESLLSRPADILVPNWMIGKPATFDLTVVSPLNSTTLNEVGARSGSAAGKAEVRKHNANDPKCTELGCVCIPLAVETYGCWGVEAQGSISRLAVHLALQLQCSNSKAITSIYQRLSLTLVRCNARALLSRARFQHCIQWARAENVVCVFFSFFFFVCNLIHKVVIYNVCKSRLLPLVKTNFELCLYLSARACMILFFFFYPGMTPYHFPFSE